MRGSLPKFLLLFLVPFLLFSACGKEQTRRQGAEAGTYRWHTFPIVVFADSSILNDPNHKDDLQDALAFWETKAGKPLFDLQGAWLGANPPFDGPSDNPENFFGNVITFLAPWAGDPNVAGKTHLAIREGIINNGIILLNPTTDFCTGDCFGHSASTSMRRLFTHELGHFLGLEHVNDPANIMYPKILPGGSLSGMKIDAAALSRVSK